jgi:Ala-tRNA(Pro) deacylase
MNSLVNYLTQRGVCFESIEHPATYTAPELAESVHVKGRDVAKPILLKTPHGFVLAIVPSTHRVDLSAMEAVLDDRPVTLATEGETSKLFPDVEIGVVPPFGSHYGLRTYLDVHLAGCATIVFQGSSHREAIRMTVEDFEMIEHPIIGLIAVGRGEWALAHASA